MNPMPLPSQSATPGAIRFNFRLGAALFLALWCSGCSLLPTQSVTVNSLSTSTVVGNSYAFGGSQSAIYQAPEDYAAAIALVKNALSARGLHEAPAGTPPDTLIYVDFTVGPAQVTHEVTAATDLMTASTLTDWTTATRADPTSQAATHLGATSETASMLTDPSARFAKAARDSRTVDISLYPKYLRLVAISAAARSGSTGAIELWRVEAKTLSASNHLPDSLPLLVAASMDYIGEDSHGDQSRKISDSAPSLALVKNAR